MEDARAQRRARRERQVRLAWFVAAVGGALAGLSTLLLHLITDPLADVAPERRPAPVPGRCRHEHCGAPLDGLLVRR